MYPAKLRADRTRQIALVGNPNVGKSVLFNVLTGSYVTVSNYPGTTVEVSTGKARIDGVSMAVTDTPGMYSLVPITEEERVTRDLLLDQAPDIIIHVVDAKNIERMLLLTIQLIEAGLPVLLDLNMMDEARAAGVSVDVETLEQELGIGVAATVLTKRQGVEGLLKKVKERLKEKVEVKVKDYGGIKQRFKIRYDREIERAIRELSGKIKGEYGISKRALALMLLQNDEALMERLRDRERDFASVERIIRAFHAGSQAPVNYRIALARQKVVREILSKCVIYSKSTTGGLGDVIGRILMHPVFGLPVLFAVLYFGLYKFVGVFAAGTVVDFWEGYFRNYINPLADTLIESLVPYPVFQDLLVHEYGIITLGLRYAFAIVLPIVGAFFFVFAIIEDSGYLPRLAMLVDRGFKNIGLTGRAVIPMTLGFGCDTMATIVTRTLETRKERIIATLLLALAIPCSAQLGIILALLSERPWALLVWGGFVLFVLVFVGYLSSRILPGDCPEFYMEVPPLRLPSIYNVFTKTYARMYWYAIEVLPVFVFASALIWVGRLVGFFDFALSILKVVVTAIGLPEEAAVAFLFGFFRRDYGAAGLYDLKSTGVLTDGQLIVSAVTLTLFLPCVAQFAVMVKERGFRTAVGIALFILPFAFFSGYVLNAILTMFGM